MIEIGSSFWGEDMLRLKEKLNGFLILLIAEAFFVLILLPGCFRKEELVDSFFGEDILDLTMPER